MHEVPTLDLRLMRAASAVVSAQARWHSLEVRGIPEVPSGPAVLVGNHNGAASIVDALFLVEWYRQRGFDEPIFALAHEIFFYPLPMRALFERLGIIPARPECAASVLAAGGKVLVFPGNDLDSMRPWSARREVRLGGRRGFARLALAHGAPIIPVANVGGHEGLLILAQGLELAAAFGIRDRFRFHSFPITFAMPWGVLVGPFAYLPYVPWPARVVTELCPAIPPEGDVESLYAATEAALKTTVARLYDERDRAAR